MREPNTSKFVVIYFRSCCPRKFVFVSSNYQLGNVLTKSLRRPRIQFICSKLGTYNPISGKVLELLE